MQKKTYYNQQVMKMKLELFGHIARMNNSRKIKSGVMGKMDGDNRKGRPYREWFDDIKKWGQNLLIKIVQERNK